MLPETNIRPSTPVSARLSRREVLGGGCSIAVGLASRSTRLGAASPSPAVHSFQHGEFEITVISDGHLTIPAGFLAANAPKDQLEAVLKASGQTGDMVTPATNVTMIRTKSDLILIDVGAGPHFMPTAGKLADNLEAAGIDRTAVTKIIFTHGHPDHLWGTIDPFDDLVFPNATYVIGAAEWTLWMSDDVLSKIPADRQNFAPGAQRNLERIKEKLATVGAGEEIAPGIRAISTPGHTQGHVSLEIVSGKDALVVLGDALTHPVISFAHPEWRPAADHEPDRAVETRVSLLDRLASDRCRIIGYHLPFPGVGIVERSGPGFRYTAAV